MASRAASKREKLAQLRALRQQGKKTFDAYEVADADDLYEEVDDNQYKKILRDRLDQDDFVVDDNGEGYADDGREEWDREPVYYSDSEDDGPVAPRGKDRKGLSNHLILVGILADPTYSASQEAARRPKVKAGCQRPRYLGIFQEGGSKGPSQDQGG